MINTRTIFVLGAGASRPYGFPIGTELKKEILADTGPHQPTRFLEMAGTTFEGGLKKYNAFRESLRLAGTSSVDAFLEFRPEFIDVGKAAISHILCAKEAQSRLFDVKDGDWYQCLFERMNSPFDEFQENKVGVITFNYDRSLEHYLWVAMQNRYGKTEKECAEKINAIPVIHVHGQLGNLPWQEEHNSISYGGFASSTNDLERAAMLRIATRGIKIIHEQVDLETEPEFPKAGEMLREAERIIFLGFGYHETNIERLHCKRQASGRIVEGTACGLEQGERALTQKIFRRFGWEITLAEGESDCLLFLRRYLVS